MREFGNYGSTRTILAQLEMNRLIFKPEKGMWRKK